MSTTHGLPLMVNWPSAWRPAIRHGLELARAGRAGEPVQLSHRRGHAGPREFACSAEFSAWLYNPAQNGGGALVDYCGYGAVLARVLLGQPSEVTAVSAPPRKPDLPAEDSAVVVLRYPRALALLEASWTQIGGQPAFGMIVYGDAGTLIVHQPRATRDGQVVAPGRIELVSASGSETIEPPPLPPDERDAATYFLTCLRTGRPIEGLCAPDVGRDVQGCWRPGSARPPRGAGWPCRSGPRASDDADRAAQDQRSPRRRNSIGRGRFFSTV